MAKPLLVGEVEAGENSTKEAATEAKRESPGDMSDSGGAGKMKINNNNPQGGHGVESPPPVRDLKYWLITMVCVMIWITGPLLYYAESLRMHDAGRYFQALTCLLGILVCVKLLHVCSYEVEVVSLLGVLCLWAWLFYGVVEVGRILMTGSWAWGVGGVHVGILILHIYLKDRAPSTWAEVFVWATLVLCVVFPINLPTGLSMRDGVLMSYRFQILWYMEMLYQGFVERHISAADLLIKAVPVIRLPLMGSWVYFGLVFVVRVYLYMSHQGAIKYDPPQKMKTPMSLYENVDVMFKPPTPPSSPLENSGGVGLVKRSAPAGRISPPQEMKQEPPIPPPPVHQFYRLEAPPEKSSTPPPPPPPPPPPMQYPTVITLPSPHHFMPITMTPNQALPPMIGGRQPIGGGGGGAGHKLMGFDTSIVNTKKN
jgi:hypothetical protein